MSFQVPNNTAAESALIPPEIQGRHQFLITGAFEVTKKDMIVVTMDLLGENDESIYGARVFLMFGKGDARSMATINGFLLGIGHAAQTINAEDLIGLTGWLDYKHPSDGRFGAYPNIAFYRRDVAIKSFGEPTIGKGGAKASAPTRPTSGEEASSEDTPF